MKTSRITAHVAGAGLFVGAAVWICHQQLQYVLSALFCGNGAIARMWVVSGVALFAVAVGGIMSWLAFRGLASQGDVEAQDAPRARHFLAEVGLMGALIFLYAVVLQAVALVYLPVCAG